LASASETRPLRSERARRRKKRGFRDRRKRAAPAANAAEGIRGHIRGGKGYVITPRSTSVVAAAHLRRLHAGDGGTQGKSGHQARHAQTAAAEVAYVLDRTSAADGAWESEFRRGDQVRG